MTVNDTAGQQGTDDDTTDDSGTGDQDPTDDTATTGDDQGDQDGVNRAEARLRKRAQKAEGERDELRDLLYRQRQALVDSACEAAGLTPRHIRAAEITVDAVLDDDGLLDSEALREAIDTAVTDFGIQRARPPKPVAQQGRGGGGSRGQASWSQALKGR